MSDSPMEQPAEQGTRIERALEVAEQYGGVDGDHHKAWVIDQMVRALCGCDVSAKFDPGEQDFTVWMTMAITENDEYRAWVTGYEDGDDGPQTYCWSEGIAP